MKHPAREELPRRLSWLFGKTEPYRKVRRQSREELTQLFEGVVGFAFSDIALARLSPSRAVSLGYA